jgi:hypothetical protein
MNALYDGETILSMRGASRITKTIVGPVRRPEGGRMGANWILLPNNENEHFTSIEMKKVLKP